MWFYDQLLEEMAESESVHRLEELIKERQTTAASRPRKAWPMLNQKTAEEYYSTVHEQVEEILDMDIAPAKYLDVHGLTQPIRGTSIELSSAGQIVSGAGLAFINPWTAAAGVLLSGRALWNLKYADKVSIFNGAIEMSYQSMLSGIPRLAHEIAHLAQAHQPRHFRNRALQEGHARGVERTISRLWANEHDEPGFLRATARYDLREYSTTYRLLCRRIGISPNPESLRPKNRMRVGPLYKFRKRHYPVGNAYVSLALSENPNFLADALKRS